MTIQKTSIFILTLSSLFACGQDASEYLESKQEALLAPTIIAPEEIPNDSTPKSVCTGRPFLFDYCEQASNVPDFDQARTGKLPGDGAMHCYPTTAANILTWLSLEGHLENYAPFGTPNRIDTTELFCSAASIPHTLGSGTAVEFCEGTRAWAEGITPEDFHGDAYSLYLALDNFIYSATSNLIEQLGYDMETQGMSEAGDTPDGTGTHILDLISTLEEKTGSSATVNSYRNSNCRNEPFGPRTISRLIDRGGIGALAYGFYDDGDGDGFLTRDNSRGHMVTVVGASKQGDVRKIYYHDSARTGKFGNINKERQTTFALEVATAEPVRINHKVLDASGVEIDSCEDALKWKINLPTGESAYLEALVEVVPN